MISILVVDDHSVSQRILSHTLKKSGYDTVVAGSGKEALQCFQQQSFDLMICDINMPEMDGITLLRQLREDDHYATLPVIMLTASGQDDDRESAISAGADAFLTKPTSSGDLLRLVEELLA